MYSLFSKQAEETTEKVPSEIEKKQKEVEDRLQVLNAKKHNLVQVLKQVSPALYKGVSALIFSL